MIRPAFVCAALISSTGCGSSLPRPVPVAGWWKAGDAACPRGLLYQARLKSEGGFHYCAYLRPDRIDRWGRLRRGTWVRVGPFTKIDRRGWTQSGNYQNVLHGLFESRDPTGRLRAQGGYAYGHRSGTWKTWYASGKLASVIDYHVGKRHGSAVWYHADGRIWDRATYERGRLGDARRWAGPLLSSPLQRSYATRPPSCVDAMTRFAKTFEPRWPWLHAWQRRWRHAPRGLRLTLRNTGGCIEWTTRHLEGRPSGRGQWCRGEPSGTWSWWYPNGQRLKTITFDKGVRYRWEMWHAGGARLGAGTYDGMATRGRYFHENGQLMFDTEAQVCFDLAGTSVD